LKCHHSSTIEDFYTLCGACSIYYSHMLAHPLACEHIMVVIYLNVTVCCRMPTPAHASMFAAGMLNTSICFYVVILPCIL